MDRDELSAYRRVLVRLISADDMQERNYLLASDRSEIEAVLDLHDKVSEVQRESFTPHKNK